MAERRFEDAGLYRICWCGPDSNLVYVAWFNTGANKYNCIGVCREGSAEERKTAAEAICKDHWKQRKAAG